MGEKKIIKRQIIPLLPLRGLTVFPDMILHFDVGRMKSIKALEEAMVSNQLIFLVTQKDARTDSPGAEDVFSVGTISRVKQLLKLPGDTIRVLVEGISRAEISEILQEEPFFIAETVEKIYVDDNAHQVETEALMRRVLTTFEEYAKLSNKVSPETMLGIMSVDEPGKLADGIAASVMLKAEQKQEILNEFHPRRRLECMLEMLLQEMEILEIEKNINSRVKKSIDKMQKEYYLREQMKAIQTELGDKDGVNGEIEEYKQKMEAANLPEEAEKKFVKELDRLAKMQQGSAEGSVIRTYLDWIIDLPWNKTTDEIIDLKRAQDILDEDHYGMEKVKERIIEYIAVRKLKNELKGPILCLYGPPGVGKTSIAKSIARALNRNYVRMSLGGVKDEAEIRGHRRTYVGAMPGRIITAMKQGGSKNPLILLDEIDKMNSDFRGDPASAMLEVLDGEQNNSFRDHYLEIPFDLSDVLFLTTANNLDTIPRPLLDRMEIISLSSYTEVEKVNICTKYLIPKQLEKHGLTAKQVVITEEAVKQIINCYTRESGVRNLEREIATICRRAAKKLLSEEKKTVKITERTLDNFLGIPKYRYDKANEKDEVGIATGMAWTPVGGEVLYIEVTLMSGNGKLELTGHLGDVMKESARAGMSYIRSKAEDLGIDKDFHNKLDIHIHVPEGAIPKDGPSAGITICTAIISALTGIPIRKDVAMTGEITLRGRVLPIGGLKEKVIAAHRAGIKTVIIPEENKKDVEEIPETVRTQMKFVYASSIDTVIRTALAKHIHKNISHNSKEAVMQREAKQEVAATIVTPEIKQETILTRVEQ
ncbi:MAG: endopeptidase La [Ignavibacteriales bacterium]